MISDPKTVLTASLVTMNWLVNRPAVTRSYERTHVLINKDTEETKFPARLLCKLTSANSLKDEGTSQEEASYWLMATSAIKSPETKLMT